MTKRLPSHNAGWFSRACDHREHALHRKAAKRVSRHALRATSALVGLVILFAGVSAPPVSAALAHQTRKQPSLIKVFGNGVGQVPFGAAESRAIVQLEALFGKLKSTPVPFKGNCGVTGVATTTHVEITFENKKFVGYEIGSAMGKVVTSPMAITSKGLELGDTIAQARKLYGSAFSASAAQGGSFTITTSRGRLIGLLVGPPVPVGQSDKIELLAAGFLGCPAMTP